MRAAFPTRLVLAIFLVFLAGTALMATTWPHWRGPSHNGVSAETGLPTTWGAKCKPGAAAAGGAPAARGQSSGGGRGGFFEGRPLTPLTCADFETTNIAWRIPVPAYSGSTPIVWGDLVFLNVATATNTGNLELWAVNRRTQAVAWKRPIAGNNNMQRKQNMSTPSPVTDG